jgi:hypothetical protein
LDETLREIGKIIIQESNLKENVKLVTKSLEKFTEKVKELTKTHPNLVKWVFIFFKFLMILGPLIAIIAQAVIGFAALAYVAGILGITVGALSVSIGMILAAFILVGIALYLWFTRWEDIVGGAKLLWQDLTTWVVSLWDGAINSVIERFDKVKQKFLDIKNMVGDKIKGVKDSVTGMFDFSSSISQDSSSTTDINVNLNSPRGVIKNANSKTTGKVPGLNIGMNMADAL